MIYFLKYLAIKLDKMKLTKENYFIKTDNGSLSF